ncbi:hypothetical protein REPUB_Repub14bG0076600 [Reevesia pubescens]
MEYLYESPVVLAIIITEASRIAARVTADRGGDPELKDLWSRLQLYALVLLSLTLNLVLIALGYVIKNRKGKTWVPLLTSLGYFFGDLVATAALTTILKRQLNGKIDALQVFWAPFLLLHLGSTETIAANFLDEKELWQTYTLGLIIQFGMACYIVVRFERGTDNALAYIAIPIFAAGFVKCMERLWILGFSGFKKFTNSVLSGRHKKPTSKGVPQLDAHLSRKSIIPEGRHLHKAYLSFMMFVPLFADIDLRIYNDLNDIFTMMQSTAEEAFKRVETELGLLFDVLYTKTIILDIPLGFTFRFIYFLFSTVALLAFSYANTHKQDHSKLEIYITYLLMFGAFFADSIAVISHLCSNWTLYWLTTPETWRRLPRFFHSTIASCLKITGSIGGVKYMAQHSLLNYCLKAKVNKFNAAISNKVDAKRILKKFWDIQQHAWVDVSPTWVLVDADLKEHIFFCLQKKRQKYEEGAFKFSCLSRLAKRGASDALKAKGSEIYDEINWSISKVEFTHSLLLWHIATDILFHYYQRRYPGSTTRKYLQISKKLSDYMMHLLVVRSFMLHSGISKLRYRDTCFEAMDFFSWRMKIKSKDLAEVAMTLLFLGNEPILPEVQSGGGKSVFFKGCELAKQLQSFAENARWDPEELWEMISCVWMEKLFSAAYDCDWKEHAYQLGHGGELLSHVALLMAHFGLSKHLRMIKRPKDQYESLWDWDNLSQIGSYLA